MPKPNTQSDHTGPCPMPDEVCADCGYRCGEASPEELSAAGKWGRDIWERVKAKIDGDGCCHKTRLGDAPCPIGWNCPYIKEAAENV